MADKWGSNIENGKSRYPALIDVSMWFGKATLDACVSVSIWVWLGCGLTVDSSLKRIGAGAFNYDLDAPDNGCTGVYFRHPQPKVPVLCSLVLRPSGTPYFLHVYHGEAPTRLYNNSSNPGMQKYRWDRDEVHGVPRKPLDSKGTKLHYAKTLYACGIRRRPNEV